MILTISLLAIYLLGIIPSAKLLYKLMWYPNHTNSLREAAGVLSLFWPICMAVLLPSWTLKGLGDVVIKLGKLE